jgi:hypothetical protein
MVILKNIYKYILCNEKDLLLSQEIGKTLKKLDSTCCPQCRETKADTLGQLRPIGEGDQELEKRLDQEELI